MWGRDKGELPRFCSRAEAFAFMLHKRVEGGTDPMSAAKEADEFATLFARNMGLPEVVEPEPQGIDATLATIDKISVWVDNHPKVVELLIPTVTFVAGLFTGRRTDPPPSSPPQVCNEPIDFDNIED